MKIAILALIGLLAAPAAALAQDQPAPTLDHLYERLGKAQSEKEAGNIALQIERIELQSGSDTTDLLMDRLVESQATVINTSSVAHQRYGNLDIDDLDSTHAYNATKTCGDAKLAQVLHAKELVRHFGSQGVSAVSFHPGNIATNFSNEPPHHSGFFMRRR